MHTIRTTTETDDPVEAMWDALSRLDD